MFTQNSFLTATAVTTGTQAPAVSEAPATVSAESTTQGAEVNEALQQVLSSLTPEVMEKIGANGENIKQNTTGEYVVVDPVTGVETPLKDMGVDTTALSTALGISNDGPTAYYPSEMSGAITGLYVVYGFICVVLIAFILSQNKRSAAFGNGMSNGQQSYWDKNKRHSKEGQMDFFTKIGIAVFMILTFVITLV